MAEAAGGAAPWDLDSAGPHAEDAIDARSSMGPSCQVCGVSLADAKVYLKRYRICNFHRTMNELLWDGVPQRFCQQCGKFEPLDAFEADKRTCRARLERHNAQRRHNRRVRAGGGGAPGFSGAGGASHDGDGASDGGAGASPVPPGGLLGAAPGGGGLAPTRWPAPPSAASAPEPPPPPRAAGAGSAALQVAVDMLAGRLRPQPGFQSHWDRLALRAADAGAGAGATLGALFGAGAPTGAPPGAAPHLPLASLLGEAGAAAAVAAAGGSLREALELALTWPSTHPAVAAGEALVQHGDEVAALAWGEVRQVVLVPGSAAAAPSLAAAEPAVRAAHAGAGAPLVFTLRGAGLGGGAGAAVACRHRGSFPRVDVLASGRAGDAAGTQWLQVCVHLVRGAWPPGEAALLEFEVRAGAFVCDAVPAVVLAPGQEEAAAELAALAEGLPRAQGAALLRAVGEGLRFAAAGDAAAHAPPDALRAALSGARAAAVAAAAADAGALLGCLLPAAALGQPSPAAAAAALDALCPPRMGLMHVAAAAGSRAVRALASWAAAAAAATGYPMPPSWAAYAAGAEGLTPLHLAALAREGDAAAALRDTADPAAFAAAWRAARASDGTSPADYEALSTGLLAAAAAAAPAAAPPPPGAAAPAALAHAASGSLHTAPSSEAPLPRSAGCTPPATQSLAALRGEPRAAAAAGGPPDRPSAFTAPGPAF